MIKPIYILIIIFLSINLKADYNVSNHDPIFIKNGVFVGKNEAYSYFELEAYGVYIEKKYSPEKRENLIEYIDYKDYLSFIASLSATQIANIPEFKLTPKIKITPEFIKLAEQLAREKAEQLAREKAEQLAREQAERELNWQGTIKVFAGNKECLKANITEICPKISGNASNGYKLKESKQIGNCNSNQHKDDLKFMYGNKEEIPLTEISKKCLEVTYNNGTN